MRQATPLISSLLFSVRSALARAESGRISVQPIRTCLRSWLLSRVCGCWMVSSGYPGRISFFGPRRVPCEPGLLRARAQPFPVTTPVRYKTRSYSLEMKMIIPLLYQRVIKESEGEWASRKTCYEGSRHEHESCGYIARL